jgi:hypothetical protein
MPRKNQPDSRIIKPLEEAVGPVTPLREIAGRRGVDAVVRAIAGGLTVYDAGRVLVANEGTFNILKDILATGEAA